MPAKLAVDCSMPIALTWSSGATMERITAMREGPKNWPKQVAAAITA
jgi:hypothetical protein